MIFGFCFKTLIIIAIVLMVLSILTCVTSDFILLKNVTDVTEELPWRTDDFVWKDEKMKQKCKTYKTISYVLFIIAFILILI